MQVTTYAIGGVLEQRFPDGCHPLRFESRVLNQTEQKYATAKKECLALFYCLKKLAFYLKNADFLVRTDSTTLLAWLKNPNVNDPAVSRWLAFIKTFQFKAVHIRGEGNTVADTLSRSFPSMALSDQSLYRRYQELAEYLGAPEEEKGKFSSNTIKVSKDYFLKDGQLYKQPSHWRLPPRKIIFDADQKMQIFHLFHDDIIGGHRGVKATFEKIHERFLWPKMYEEIEVYVHSCSQCQEFSKRRQVSPLTPTFTSGVLQKVHVDIVHMPVGKGIFRYFIDAKDNLSGYVDGQAIKANNTSTFLKFIKNFIHRYGYPERIVSDRGEFKAKEIKDYLRSQGIQLVLATSYHPQGNATVERGHQELVGSMEKWLGGKRDHNGRLKKGAWPDYLPYAFLATNITIKRSTGYTPFELFFGRKPSIPILRIPPDIKTFPVIGFWRSGF